MATFAVNQRVMVPRYNPTAEARLRGKEGVVTSVGRQPPRNVENERAAFMMEQQYFVRFDDNTIGAQMMFERELEAA